MKRYLALLLAGLMALSIAACGPATDPEDTTDSSKQTTIDEDYLSKITDKRYDGKTFTWLSNSDYDFPKESSGDNGSLVVDEAVAKRFELVSNQFGVKFNFLVSGGSGASVDMINQEFMSNGDSYNVATGSYVYLAGPLVHNGLSMDIAEFKAINLDNPWWSKYTKTDLAIAGHTYFLTGPIVRTYFEDTAAWYFNKDLFDQFQLEDPYALVEAGKWTFDKMTEMASVAGTQAESGYWQLQVSDIVGYNLFFAAGEKITYFDENNEPYVLSTPTEKMINICDEYSAYLTQLDRVISPTLDWYLGITRTDEEKANREFKGGNILFYGATTGDAIALRNEDLNFGILPTPTYEEGQEYVGYTNVWGAGALNFPKTQGANTEMTGVIAEALAYTSYTVLKPAVYDKMLMGRSAPDSESAAMLDLVFENKCYDLCDVMEWGQLNYFVRDNVLGGYDTLVSDWATIYEAAQAGIANTIKYYKGE